MNIYDLKPLKEVIRGALIWVEYPNGEINKLAESFNIEDEALFLTVEENSNVPFNPLKLGSLFDYLDHERKYDCWHGYKDDAILEGPNTLYDCDIKVYDANSDQVFELEEFNIKNESIIFKAVPCEEVNTQMSPKRLKTDTALGSLVAESYNDGYAKGIKISLNGNIVALVDVTEDEEIRLIGYKGDCDEPSLFYSINR
ncbi:hypothetical protein [Lachnospira multipara]|uniref:Uncharacterized protein n=1 Tax=Lachnospira multipara TaxID=28051 RepID=A0A1H5VPW2_9FIRM|nr:hypothetical protein [Lachnospira multipara]SEF89365.1 hypothetical protein SAMN05216537_11225 [Lachnospira multipara]